MADAETERDVAEVRRAGERIVKAYGDHETERYFACFHPDATFVFYTSPKRIESTARFREEWDRWEREDGFHVLGCVSADQRVQLLGDVAVLTHSLTTRLTTNEGEETARERETIVFARQRDGDWLVVHEHLSPDPSAGRP